MNCKKLFAYLSFSMHILDRRIDRKAEHGNMIELKKKNVHMNERKMNKLMQISVGEDVVISDTKPDVEAMIASQGDVEIQSVTPQNGKAAVKGKLLYGLLYEGPESVHRAQGEIPFEEIVNLEEIEQGDSIHMDWDLDDLQISAINSRKISVRAVVTLQITVERLTDSETAVELIGENVEYLKKPLEITEIVVHKKDIYRVKEDIELGQNKPDIGQILWESVNVQGLETRLMQDKIAVSGELVAFIMYQPSQLETPMQWLEAVIPFRGLIEAEGCQEEMIPQISVKLGHKQLEPKADSDGELRMFALDAVLDLDIKVYQEMKIDVISDLYGTASVMEPVREPGHYENLLIKNDSKCKINQKISLGEQNTQVMQICNVKGMIRIEEISVTEDGLQVDGIVNVTVLYISGDDKCPLKSVSRIIPFTHNISVPGIREDSLYFIRPGLESISANMVSMNELEIKAVISLDTLVLNQMEESVITGVTERPFDLEMLEEMPCMVGYSVQKAESLWDIAKENFTKIRTIMEINGLSGEKVEPGQKIIIVKEASAMLQ